MWKNLLDVKEACIAASLTGLGGGERNRTAGLLIANQRFYAFPAVDCLPVNLAKSI